jgi:energy-coupling factor transport system permease protein
MGLEYIPGKTIIHKMDPRTRIIWAFTIIFVSGLFTDPIFLTLTLLSIYTVSIIAKIPMKKIWSLYKPLVFVYLLYFILNIIWFREDIVLLSIFKDTFVITLGGLIYTMGVLIRFTCMITVVRVLTLITSTSEVVLALVKFKLPKEICMAIGLGLSYVNVLINQTRTIMDAQMARGWSFEYRNPIKLAKAYLPLLLPTIFISMYRGMQIAAAIESKGYENVPRRTYRKELKFTNLDYAFVGICLFLAILGLILWLLGVTDYGFSIKLIKSYLRII